MPWVVAVIEPGPTIVGDDGVRRTLSWELLDGCALATGDEVRAKVSAAGEVEALLPRCTTSEALAILREAGVVDVGAADGDDDTTPWPLVVLGPAFEAGGPGVFAHDHEYLELEAARRWAALSLAPGLEVRSGDDDGDEPALVCAAAGVDMRSQRAVGLELVASLNDALEHLGAGHRWYTLPAIDERGVHLRLDRETAKRLGVGVFSRRDR